MTALKKDCRPLASPSVFAQFLEGEGAMTDRARWADEADYNRHARKLDFEGHLRALVLLHTTAYESTAYESARDLAWAAAEDLLFRALGADFDISVPGLGQAMAERPIAPYWQMLERVQAAVERLPHQRLRGISGEEWSAIADLFESTHLFDATRIELPPTLAEWHQTREEKAGFKLQLKLGGRSRELQEALITAPVGNDNEWFDDLLDLGGEADSREDRARTRKGRPGDLYLFDCGYWSIEQYHRIDRGGNDRGGDFFVTKLHGNIEAETVCERPVPDQAANAAGCRSSNTAGYRVRSDRYVRIGDDRSDRRGGRPGRWYRAVVAETSTGTEATGTEVEILSNLRWLDAEQICRLYRHRWSIEILFRWLKDRMQLDHFISEDPTGVIRQTLTALIVWGLLAIFHQSGQRAGDPGSFSPKKLWRELQAAMHQALFDLGRRYQAGLDPPRHKSAD